MKTQTSNISRASLLFLCACLALPAMAETLQLSSVLNSALSAPAGGSGDSLNPVISADGRYVLFASAANNLVLNSSSNPITPVFPPKMNVFLRDRTNGTTTLISVNLTGAGGGNGDSFPVDISTNGQYILFESSATNLVAGDTNNAGDIFVRDLVHGTTTLVSISTNGGFGNGVSRSSAMTPDGRYVAFVSSASNLASGGSNNVLANIFVRDLQGGTTSLASVGASGPGSSSELPDITPDGHYVAFYSTATNLVPGITNSGEIYVRNLSGGITTWASAGAHSIAQSIIGTSNTISYNHTISDDGQSVAYEASSSANPLAQGIILRYSLITGLTDIVNTNATGLPASGNELNHRCLDMTPDGRFIAFVGKAGTNSAIYVWDAQSATSTLASANTNGALSAVAICDWPVMDPTGRYVAFLSSANDLTTNIWSGGSHLYLRDMQAVTTVLVDSDTNGVGSLSDPTFPRMSANGMLVAFESYDGTLVANDNNHAYDVFVSNLASNAIELTSAHLPSLPSLTPNGPSTLTTLSVSTNARYVAFFSDADNLVAGDTNGFRDVFVRDLLLGTNILVSVDTNGILPGTGLSTGGAISANGRYVAFTSSASNLVTLADANNAQDVFIRDLQLNTTTLVSVNTSGNGSGTAASYSPILSYDGRYVLFRSVAANLATGANNGYENLYFRDTQAGTTKLLTTNNGTYSYVASMTSDGHNIAYGGSGVKLYIWNSQSGNFTYTNSATIFAISISPSGTRLAYITNSSGTQIHVADLASNSNLTLGSSPTHSHPGLQFSGDSRYLTYAALDSNQTNQVWLYDYQTQSNLLVSKAFSSSSGGNGNSDSPAISVDGRFIAYRSFASNIVPNDNNGVPDVFLYDQTTGDTTLISVSLYGNASAAARSLTPVFSGDSQTLVFQSWAADLVPQDGNQGSDVFALSLYSTNSIASFSVGILQPATLGQGPTITWPSVPGVSYQVQFKNHLTDSNWQVLPGNITLVGAQGYATDLAPSTTQRFYRIVLTH